MQRRGEALRGAVHREGEDGGVVGEDRGRSVALHITSSNSPVQTVCRGWPLRGMIIRSSSAGQTGLIYWTLQLVTVFGVRGTLLYAVLGPTREEWCMMKGATICYGVPRVHWSPQTG